MRNVFPVSVGPRTSRHTLLILFPRGLQKCSAADPAKKKETKGISLKSNGVTLNETVQADYQVKYSFDYITRIKAKKSAADKNPPMREFFASLCQNCEFMVWNLGGVSKQFQPLYHLEVKD